MVVHYTTFVLPRGTFGLDYDVPVFVIAADDGRLPADLPTSLHRRGREVMPFSHATMMPICWLRVKLVAGGRARAWICSTSRR